MHDVRLFNLALELLILLTDLLYIIFFIAHGRDIFSTIATSPNLYTSDGFTDILTIP